MSKTRKLLQPPRVALLGDAEHPDFAEIMARIRADGLLRPFGDPSCRPELIIIAESRPGVVHQRAIECARRSAPLAAVVWLLGSWCEGEARASRPAYDALRLYWYEFPAWWDRQLALRAAGKCPDWAKPEYVGFQPPPLGAALPAKRTGTQGLVVVRTDFAETAEALADVLVRVGYAAVCERPGRKTAPARGIAAGIWEGGQLGGAESDDLAAFCRRLAIEAAPVIAIVDFPRRDLWQMAQKAGASALIGKPWRNDDLLAGIRQAIEERRQWRVA